MRMAIKLNIRLGYDGLKPFTTIVQLYITYQCISSLSQTSAPHNSMSKKYCKPTCGIKITIFALILSYVGTIICPIDVRTNNLTIVKPASLPTELNVYREN